MTERDLTITDLEPLFAGREIVYPHEIGDYLRLSHLTMLRYIRAARIVPARRGSRPSANRYTFTRAQLAALIDSMLREEGNGF